MYNAYGVPTNVGPTVAAINLSVPIPTIYNLVTSSESRLLRPQPNLDRFSPFLGPSFGVQRGLIAICYSPIRHDAGPWKNMGA